MISFPNSFFNLSGSMFYSIDLHRINYLKSGIYQSRNKFINTSANMKHCMSLESRLDIITHNLMSRTKEFFVCLPWHKGAIVSTRVITNFYNINNVSH